MDHTRIPILDTLLEHRSKQTTSFHVPGHKFGAGLNPIASDALAAVMSIDVTELTGLDDLHQPEGIIREAEQLAADCFGAKASFLLVGGSTSGNLAAILSMCKQGHNDVFIVQRNVHQSIIHGLMLARAQAVFVAPQIDIETGISTGVHMRDMEAALILYPQAVGVILSNPNYYGMGVDLSSLIDCVHAADIPVLVDEAHGAHYGFHPDVPQSALSAGADAVVQSTHKMLTAMTMGAVLHIQGNRMDVHIVRQNLSIVQSSSPSYPILASLDLSRQQLKLHGHSLLEKALQAVNRFRQSMEAMPWFRIIGASNIDSQAYTTLDPLKLTICDTTATLTGFELQHLLEDNNCYPEMADPRYVVLAFSLVSQEQHIDHLLIALQRISKVYELDRLEYDFHSPLTIEYLPISEPVSFTLPRSEYAWAGLDEVNIDEAVGHRALQAITPYPPGIPIIYPGETVSSKVAAQLKLWLQSGARIHGLTEKAQIRVQRG
jgi:arginine decarboxylase